MQRSRKGARSERQMSVNAMDAPSQPGVDEDPPAHAEAPAGDGRFALEQAALQSCGLSRGDALLLSTYSLDRAESVRLLLEGYVRSAHTFRVLVLSCLCILGAAFWNICWFFLGAMLLAWSVRYFHRMMQVRAAPSSLWGLRTLLVTEDGVMLVPHGTLLLTRVAKKDIDGVLATARGYHLLSHGYPFLTIPRRACSQRSLEAALFGTEEPAAAVCPRNPCTALTDYELRHLVAHLETRGRDEDLHRLLALETSEPRNAWFQVVHARLGLDAYRDDLHRAWRCAEAKASSLRASPETRREMLGVELRYSLISATLKSTARVQTTLLVELVRRDLVPQRLALQYLNPKDLSDFVPAVPVPEELAVEALARLEASPDDVPKVKGLAALLPQLDPERRGDVLEKALRIARSASDAPHGASRAVALSSLVPWVGPDRRSDLVREVFRMIFASKDLSNETRRKDEELARSVDPGFWEEHENGSEQRSGVEMSFSLAVTMQGMVAQHVGREERAGAMRVIAPYLPAPMLEEAVNEAISSPGEYIDLLEPLLPRLSDELKERLVVRVQRDLSGVEEERRAAYRLLLALVPHLSGRGLTAAMAAAEAIAEPWSRAEILRTIASHSEEGTNAGTLDAALRASLQIEQGASRAETLATLAPLLGPGTRVRAVRQARKDAGSLDAGARAKVLATLVAAVDVDEKPSLLSLARAAAETVSHTPSKIVALLDVAEAAEGEEREAILGQACEALEGRWEQVSSYTSETVARFAQLGSNRLLMDLWAEARTIRDEETRAELFASIFGHLSVGQKRWVVSGLSVPEGDSSRRGRILAAIAGELSDGDRLMLASRPARGQDAVELFRALDRHLPPAARRKVRARALAASRRASVEERVADMSALAQHLSGKQSKACLEAALSAADRLQGTSLISALTSIVPSLRYCPNPSTLIKKRLIPLSNRVNVLGALALHRGKAARDLWDLLRQSRQALTDEAWSHKPPQYAGLSMHSHDVAVLLRLIAHQPEMERLATLLSVLEREGGMADDLLAMNAMEIARTLDALDPQEGHAKLEAMSELVGRLGGAEQSEAMRTVVEMADQTFLAAERRAAALAALMQFQPDEEIRTQTARRALDLALGIDHEFDRQERSIALAAVAAQARLIPDDAAIIFWRLILHELGRTRTRPDMLSDLIALLPLADRIGGPELASHLSRSVESMGRWWP
jgi:hypothetical protein